MFGHRLDDYGSFFSTSEDAQLKRFNVFCAEKNSIGVIYAKNEEEAEQKYLAKKPSDKIIKICEEKKPQFHALEDNNNAIDNETTVKYQRR
jgi:hypothetical protein